MHSRLTLILGGAASGKSGFAEQLSHTFAKDRVYLATAQAFDAEMRAKIDRHIERRGPGWTTVEAPDDITPALNDLTADQVCLLDCATMWLNNQILAQADLGAAQTELMQAIQSCAADLIVVSNEVGQGIVPDNPLARQFREAQGRLNILLAAQADLVVHVVAGLPQILKGELP